jgi:hypothetical protein
MPLENSLAAMCTLRWRVAAKQTSAVETHALCQWLIRQNYCIAFGAAVVKPDQNALARRKG